MAPPLVLVCLALLLLGAAQAWAPEEPTIEWKCDVGMINPEADDSRIRFKVPVDSRDLKNSKAPWDDAFKVCKAECVAKLGSECRSVGLYADGKQNEMTCYISSFCRRDKTEFMVQNSDACPLAKTSTYKAASPDGQNALTGAACKKDQSKCDYCERTRTSQEKQWIGDVGRPTGSYKAKSSAGRWKNSPGIGDGGEGEIYPIPTMPTYGLTLDRCWKKCIDVAGIYCRAVSMEWNKNNVKPHESVGAAGKINGKEPSRCMVYVKCAKPKTQSGACPLVTTRNGARGNANKDPDTGKSFTASGCKNNLYKCDYWERVRPEAEDKREAEDKKAALAKKTEACDATYALAGESCGDELKVCTAKSACKAQMAQQRQDVMNSWFGPPNDGSAWHGSDHVIGRDGLGICLETKFDASTGGIQGNGPFRSEDVAFAARKKCLAPGNAKKRKEEKAAYAKYVKEDLMGLVQEQCSSQHKACDDKDACKKELKDHLDSVSESMSGLFSGGSFSSNEMKALATCGAKIVKAEEEKGAKQREAEARARAEAEAKAKKQKEMEAEKAQEIGKLWQLIRPRCPGEEKACEANQTCKAEQEAHIALTIKNLGSLYSGDFSKASALFQKLVACGQEQLFQIEATANFNGKVRDIAEEECAKEWSVCNKQSKCKGEVDDIKGKLFAAVEGKTTEYVALGKCTLAAKEVADKAEIKEIWATIEATCPTEHKTCATDKTCVADLEALIRSASGPPTPRNTEKLYKGYLCVDQKLKCAEACVSGKKGNEKSCQKDCGWGKRSTNDVLAELAIQCPTQLKLCTTEEGCMELFTKAHETNKVSKPSTALTMLLKCSSATTSSTATTKIWASKDSLHKKCPRELKTCTNKKECVSELVKSLQLSSPPRSGSSELIALIKCYYAVKVPKIGCECRFGKPYSGLACLPGDPMKCAKCLPGYRLKKTDNGGAICYKPTPRFKLPPQERKALIEAEIRIVQEKKAAKKAKAAAVLTAKIAARDKRSTFEKGKEKIDKEKVSAKLTVAADIKKIAPGTTARKDFEADFKKTMAKTLQKSKVSEDDIVIDAIKETKDGDGGRRRQLDGSDSSLTVDFSIVAPKIAADGSTTVLKEVTDLKSSETQIELSVGGETVSVVPKSAVAEVANKNEDIDCKGTWSECLESCTRIFTRTTAQSNAGEDCPVEEACIPRSGMCDLNSKAAAFRMGDEQAKLFSGPEEAFEDGTVCRKTAAGTGQRYVCDRG